MERSSLGSGRTLEELGLASFRLLEFYWLWRDGESVGGDKGLMRQQRSGANLIEELSLSGLEFNKQGQNIEYI